MDDPIAFLNDRYNEQELVARAAGAASWYATQEETTDGHNVYSTLRADGGGDTFAHTYDAEADKVQHIALRTTSRSWPTSTRTSSSGTYPRS